MKLKKLKEKIIQFFCKHKYKTILSYKTGKMCVNWGFSLSPEHESLKVCEKCKKEVLETYYVFMEKATEEELAKWQGKEEEFKIEQLKKSARLIE